MAASALITELSFVNTPDTSWQMSGWKENYGKKREDTRKGRKREGKGRWGEVDINFIWTGSILLCGRRFVYVTSFITMYVVVAWNVIILL